MAKLTLLTMVQKILSSMDSDDVNSISDTEEALQIVDIIEDTYNHMLIQINPPSLDTTTRLTDVSDTDQPTTLQIPEGVIDIDKIKYEVTDTGDTNREFKTLIWLKPQDFVDKLLTRSSGDSNVQELLSPTNTPLFVFTDAWPTYWTSFDDEHIVCDSYVATESATLLGSKTMTLCTRLPSFTKSDTFVPELAEKAFPLLLAESKQASHVYLKQQASPIDAKRALQGNHTFRHKKDRAHDRKRQVNYGRK